MTATKRQGFTRLETNTELVERVRVTHPGVHPLSHEDIDQFAERLGFQRRIVEDKS